MTKPPGRPTRPKSGHHAASASKAGSSSSEQLLQVVPQKLGRYLYYRIGETTIGQLADAGVIPRKDYTGLIAKKPDGLIVYHRQVIGVVESKAPHLFDTPAKEKRTIEQEIDVARKLCKLLILTDNSSKSVWVNSLNGERVLLPSGAEVTAIFDSKLTKNVGSIERLVEDIDRSLTPKNSTLLQEKEIDPSDLARQMWQTIWVATGKSPVKCLYNVVELLIFKFLSDLKVLDPEYSFPHVFDTSRTNPEEALRFYARNSRVQITERFPKGADGTTIINGTIFVDESGNPNLSQATLFQHSLRQLHDYEHSFGSFVKIDRNFKTKLYETFLKQEVEALGQYFTTRKVVQSIVRMSGLDEEGRSVSGLRICDPFCGVGGFLLEILNLNEKMRQLYRPDSGGEIHLPFVMHGFDKGFEKDEERTIILAKANMLIYLSDVVFRNPHETLEFARVFNETFTLLRDNLATFGRVIEAEDEKYNFILTNPPYVTRGVRIIKQEIKSKGLAKCYPVNAYGLEGLAVEWVIRSLKKGGKAFIVLPDGVMERAADRKLRDYILRECFLDAIISLPVRTFFANERKTYILAITKKQDVDDSQGHGVFTYLVSDIGEDLTKKGRYEIPANDLPEMETLFAMYQAIRDHPEHHPKILRPRCKIVPVAELRNAKGWRIERRWSDEELKDLGLLEEPTGPKAIMDAIDNTRVFLDNLRKAEEEAVPTLDGPNFSKFAVSDLFEMHKGKSGYGRKYFKAHPGGFPVYSSQTTRSGIMGSIDHYDFDTPNCLTWTTDGVYAGTVFLRQGKFSMTSHCGILLPRSAFEGGATGYDPGTLHLPYIYHVLKRKLRRAALGQTDQNKRVTVDVIREVAIEIPTANAHEFDLQMQKDLAVEFDAIESVSDSSSQAERQLFELLKKRVFR